MSILTNKNTRLIVQGITGKQGSFHAELCEKYGTNIVAGISPGKEGTFFKNIPIYNTVKRAVKEKKANASIILVPAPYAIDAIMEAIDAGLDFVVCITEGIPIQDTMRIKAYLKNKKTKLIGPNSPGLISPGDKAKIGIMPAHIYRNGNIGVISRSGTLTYEVVAELSKNGFGQSTCIGIGGDPIIGTNFIDCLQMFEKDKETSTIVMIGEIGGNAEEKAAEYIKKHITKPVIAYICGLTAPPEKQMGHAGAIISKGKGTAEEKIKKLKNAGIEVANTIEEISAKIKT